MDSFWAECCGFSECVNALKSLMEIGYVKLSPACAVLLYSRSDLYVGEDDYIV